MPSVPKLPSWTDPGSIATFLLACFTLAFGIAKAVSPSLTQPGWVQGLVPVVALVITLVAITVNVVTHRKAHKESLVASLSQEVHSTVVQADVKALAKQVVPLLPKAEAVDVDGIVAKVKAGLPAAVDTEKVVQEVIGRLTAAASATAPVAPVAPA